MQNSDLGEVIEQDVALCYLIRSNRAMIVIDVQVEFDEDLFIFVLVGGRECAGIKSVFGLQDASDTIHVRLSDTGDIVNRLRIGRACRLELLVVYEEPQFVFDNRSTEREAVGIFTEIADAEFDTFRFVAGQAVVSSKREDTAFKLVSTGLGDNVDVAADEVAVRNIVRSDVYVDGFNRIDRNRCPLCSRCVFGKAEVVILRDAVNGDAVETEVLPGH